MLQELQKDGRISNAELAGKVGLSASACLRRVQELERSGVISGYRAVMDPAKLGIGFTAYISVGLSDHSKRSQLAFEKAITRSQEVTECHNITGSVEYLLRVEIHGVDCTRYDRKKEAKRAAGSMHRQRRSTFTCAITS